MFSPPKSEVRPVPLASLVEAERNANEMDPESFASLKEAIRRLGFVQPILVEDLGDGTFQILDGHHRSRAARDLGFVNVDAVVLPPGAGTPEIRAIYGLSLNRHRGHQRDDIAALILADLVDVLAPDMVALTGYTQADVDHLLSLAAASDTADPLESALPLASEKVSEPTDDVSSELKIPMTAAELRRVKKALARHAGGRDGEWMRRGILAALFPVEE